MRIAVGFLLLLCVGAWGASDGIQGGASVTMRAGNSDAVYCYTGSNESNCFLFALSGRDKDVIDMNSFWLPEIDAASWIDVINNRIVDMEIKMRKTGKPQKCSVKGESGDSYLFVVKPFPVAIAKQLPPDAEKHSAFVEVRRGDDVFYSATTLLCTEVKEGISPESIAKYKKLLAPVKNYMDMHLRVMAKIEAKRKAQEEAQAKQLQKKKFQDDRRKAEKLKKLIGAKDERPL